MATLYHNNMRGFWLIVTNVTRNVCLLQVAENNSMQQELQKMINQLTKRENAVTKKEQEVNMSAR